MRHRRLRLGATLFVLAGVSLLATDALAKKRSSTPVTSSVKGLEVSPRELRIRVRAMIRPTLGIIEEHADRIIAASSDPSVRRGVLVWKIEMTTTLLAAMLRSDPILALADAWGYVVQVENLLARPDTQAKYGPITQSASEPLGIIEAEFREFTAGLKAGPTGDALEATVHRWAERHPIEGALYRRPSMDSAVAAALASSTSGGAFSVLGSLDETTADVVARMDLYTMYLPRLARWEAELAADDLTRGSDPKALAAELERFARAVDRIAAVTETASDLAARERGAAIEAVRRERLAVVEDLRAERIATLAELEAIAQRLADRASAPVHEAVRADLTELVKSVEEMRKRLTVDAREALVEVVDHAFLRLAQLLAAFLVLVLVGLGFWALFLRQGRA